MAEARVFNGPWTAPAGHPAPGRPPIKAVAPGRKTNRARRGHDPRYFRHAATTKPMAQGFHKATDACGST